MASEDFFSTITKRRVGMVPRSIIEGREIQSDGGEKDKDNLTTKQPQTTTHRPSLHHLVVFPGAEVKQVKTKTTDCQWA